MSSRLMRYDAIVDREIQSRNLRDPIWKTSLDETGGREDLAIQIYREKRVVQMLADEETFDANLLNRQSQRQTAEEPALAKQWQHMGVVVGIVVLLWLAIVIYYFLEKYHQTGSF